MTDVTAIVLAGGRDGDPVAAQAGVPLKAFAPVAGAAMLDRVVGALLASPAVGRLALVLPEGAALTGAPRAAAALADGAAVRIDAAATPSDSVVAALDALEAPFPALIVTADLALLTPAIVAEFLARAPDETDVAVALAPEAVCRGPLRGGRRAWARFRDGGYSGFNLFLLVGPRARDAVKLWGMADSDRRKPWRLARLLGHSSLLTYALGRLSLDEACARLRDRFGLAVAPVVLSDPNIAIDVDRPADLGLAERLIAEREAAGA